MNLGTINVTEKEISILEGVDEMLIDCGWNCQSILLSTLAKTETYKKQDKFWHRQKSEKGLKRKSKKGSQNQSFSIPFRFHFWCSFETEQKSKTLFLKSPHAPAADPTPD